MKDDKSGPKTEEIEKSDKAKEKLHADPWFMADTKFQEHGVQSITEGTDQSH